MGVAPRDRTRGYHVAICRRLRGEKLVDTALHEARHVFQHALPKEFKDHETREGDAAGFAPKWTPSVMLAWKRFEGGYVPDLRHEARPDRLGALR